MSRPVKHLSYANVVFALCVVLLLGAGAHAAVLAKDSVRSPQIQNGQVKRVDLGSDAVTTSKVDDDSLTGADTALESITNRDFAPDSLGGVDIAEETLDIPDSDTVGGMAVKPVRFLASLGTPKQPVLEFPGQLTIYAACQASGDQLDVSAVPGVDDTTISAFVGDSGVFEVEDLTGHQDAAGEVAVDFDTIEEFEIDDVHPGGGAAAKVAMIDFSTPGGFVAHLDLSLEWRSSSATEGTCKLTGTAIGG